MNNTEQIFTKFDFIETAINGTVHVARAFSNTALCGAPLIGKIRPRDRAHLNCPQCKAQW